MNKKERNEYVVDANNGFEALKQCLDFIREQLYVEDKMCKKVKHQDKFIFRGIRRAKDAGIRSGAAIRIERKYGPNYTFIDYINYHKSLIDNVKKKFPKNCIGKSDLDILAELQHNGAATCLIDFTYNFFASLWFACGKAEISKGMKEGDRDGLVYCLNVNDCLINRESMFVITEEKKMDPIEKLLKMTQRFVDFDAKYKYKFWFWQPNKFNDRVTIQDGLFIFGMEKFDIDENNVKVLRIKEHCKNMILDIMAKYFNLSVTTIYPDVNGYADANNKLMEIEETSWEGQGCLSKGVSYMLQGNMNMALEYFDRFESCIKPKVKDRVHCTYKTTNCSNGMYSMMELYYYKAEAFKLSKHPNRAILNYREVRDSYNEARAVQYCKKLGSKGSRLKARAESRVFTSYSQELLMMYETKRFADGVKLCKEIIDQYKGKEVNVDYAKISLIEMELLNLEYKIRLNSLSAADANKLMQNCYNRCSKYVKKFEEQIPKGGFYSLLLLFFDLFAKVFCKKEEKYNINEWIERLWKVANNIDGAERDFICDWYLYDIQEAVNELSRYDKRHSDLLYLIARFNEIQDYLNVKLLKRKVE